MNRYYVLSCSACSFPGIAMLSTPVLVRTTRGTCVFLLLSTRTNPSPSPPPPPPRSLFCNSIGSHNRLDSASARRAHTHKSRHRTGRDDHRNQNTKRLRACLLRHVRRVPIPGTYTRVPYTRVYLGTYPSMTLPMRLGARIPEIVQVCRTLPGCVRVYLPLPTRV